MSGLALPHVRMELFTSYFARVFRAVRSSENRREPLFFASFSRGGVGGFPILPSGALRAPLEAQGADLKSADEAKFDPVCDFLKSDGRTTTANHGGL